MSQAWFQKLNDSPWMGTICEVGIGVPFQHAFASIPGASKTILFAHCPYNQAFQPPSISRSVSLEMSTRYAWIDFAKIAANDEVQKDNLFSLAVTASHKTPKEDGETHGWVTVVTRKKEDQMPESYSFHFRASKILDRATVGLFLSDTIQWFLDKVLLHPEASWNNYIRGREGLITNVDNESFFTAVEFQIDVIKAPNISIEEHLLLATDHNPLLYHLGEFKRTTDYFRTYNKLLGGSFNPPTQYHFELGQDALFCLDFENPRKEGVSEADLAHRIRMLNTEGVPVLINRGRKYIVEINEIAVTMGMKNPTFIVGVDTFNAICNQKYIPFPNFLEPIYREHGTKFVVNTRTGYEPVDNEWSRRLNFIIVTVGDNTNEASSTQVRNGELSLTTPKIRDYILSNKLYQ